MLTIQQVAADLGVSVMAARPLVASMTHLRHGRMIRVAPEDLADWKERGGREAWISYLIDRTVPKDLALAVPRRVVYFVSNGPKFIKIGTTENLALRINALRTASPFNIEIVATLGGGIELERKLHARFARLRHRGEWFRRVGDLAKLLERAEG